MRRARRSEEVSYSGFLIARLTSILQLLALLSMAAMAGGLFGRWHFVADLASHFRIQATVALVVGGLLLWPLGCRRWSAASVVFGAVLAVSLLPFLWPSGPPGPGTCRLLTLNVLTSNQRRDLVIDYILECDPDFILLQETDRQWNREVGPYVGSDHRPVIIDFAIAMPITAAGNAEPLSSMVLLPSQ